MHKCPHCHAEYSTAVELQRHRVDKWDHLRERYDEVVSASAKLLKAINDDERNGINNETLKALVALRLILSPTGAINHIVQREIPELPGT